MPGMPGSGEVTPEEWDSSLAALRELYMQSSGLEQRKLDAQIRDAEEGRKNAMAMARLQAETSRYGVDATRQTAMAQLKQRAKEFEATHALELKKFGLSYAQTATEYLSTPDRFAESISFFDMANRVMGRQPGVAPYGSNTDFQPKTQADFAVLAGGAPQGQGAPASMAARALETAGSGRPNMTPGPQSQAATAATGGPASATAQGDPRSKVLKNMIDAVPPSRGAGMDQNDFAVLKAAEALYSTNLPPGAYERMLPDQQKMLGSFIRRSGRSLPNWLAQTERNRPGQGSVRAAG